MKNKILNTVLCMLLVAVAVIAVNFYSDSIAEMLGLSIIGKSLLTANIALVKRNIGNAQGGTTKFAGKNVVARPTQYQKIGSTADKFGYPILGAQLTERGIYDSLPLDGRTVFNFFQEVNKRAFPRTNLSENKLQTQENMIVKCFSLEVVTYDSATGSVVSAVNPLSTAFPGLYRSDLSFLFGQSQVVKPFPVDRMKPEFNPHAKHNTNNVYRLLCDLTIPQFIEFVATLRTCSYTASATFQELQLTLSGGSTLLSPQATY